MRKMGWWLKVGAVVLVFAAAVVVALMNTTASTVSSGNIPQMYINLDEVTLEEIDGGSKFSKYTGNEMILTYGGEELKYGDMEIGGRGNSTWGQVKKPYQIKFDKKINLLGMGQARKWVLLADYLDKSHLRNDLAFYVENMIGEEYALTGKYVELYINGDYRGLYYVAPKVEIGKNRVDLKDAMGVLVELENLHDAYEVCYASVEDDCIVVKDLVNDDNEIPAMQDFMESFDELILAAHNGEYDKVAKLIDVESFAKYYLISEFAVNPDAYLSSFFLYKDGVGDKIHAGPGWDFDLAFANKKWSYAREEGFYLPYNKQVMREYSFDQEIYDEELDEMVSKSPETHYSKLMYYMIDMPEFEEKVKEVYREVMAGKRSVLAEYMRGQIDLIRDAVLRDEQKWGDEFDVGFDAEAERLLDWIMKRYDYFEEEYGTIGELKKMVEEV